MKRLLLLELKIRIKLRSTQILLILGILWSILVAIFTINTGVSRQIILDDSGKVVYSSGKEAVEYLKETQKNLEGYLTEEKLAETFKKYEGVLEEYDKEVKNVPLEIYAKNITPINNILDIIVYSHMPYYEGERDSSGMLPLGFKPEDAEVTYRARKETLQKSWVEKFGYDSEVYLEISEKENKVKEPFYFMNYSGWDALEINWTLMLNPVLILLSCVLLAPTFSKGYEDNSDRVFRATKFGRKDLGIVRIISGLIVSVGLYIICIVVNLSMVLPIFNFQGLNASVQFINLFSSANLKIVELLGVNIIGSLLTILTMGIFTLFMSATLKSSVAVLATSVMIVIINVIFNISQIGNIENNSIYFMLNTFSPFGLNSLSSTILLNSYFVIGRIAVWLPYGSLIGSIGLASILFFMTIRNYCGHQA